MDVESDCGGNRFGAPRIRLVAAVLLLVLAAAGPARSASSVPATEIARRVLTRPVTLNDVVVRGDLDLQGRSTRGFTCRHCRFQGDLVGRRARIDRLDIAGSSVAGKFSFPAARFGSLDASNVGFAGIVDLRHAYVHKDAEFTGTTFAAPALFGQARSGQVSFDGAADFSLAWFRQLASFESVDFNTDASFSFARFDGVADFTNAEADGSIQFGRAIFGDGADFSNATFYGPTHFGRARFGGSADFGSATFNGRAGFAAADFRGASDFSQVTFSLPVSFESVHFGGTASFFAVQFRGAKQPQTSNDFDAMSADGRVDFSQADFGRDATFADSAPADLELAQATFEPRVQLDLNAIAPRSLELTVPQVLVAVHDYQPGDRARVLSLVEASAKARDDLGPANSAHYEHQVLVSDRFGAARRLADFVFYRWMAGYFVRPSNPLLVLLLVAAGLTLVRIGAESWRASARTSRFRALTARLGPAFSRAVRAVRHFPDRFVASLALVVPRRGETAAPIAYRVEALLYRVLVACALIGFANTNPTLRQMFDALR
jgi:uncharacterized protein YjbI with pentapeptide repeats